MPSPRLNLKSIARSGAFCRFKVYRNDRYQATPNASPSLLAHRSISFRRSRGRELEATPLVKTAPPASSYEITWLRRHSVSIKLRST